MSSNEENIHDLWVKTDDLQKELSSVRERIAILENGKGFQDLVIDGINKKTNKNTDDDHNRELKYTTAMQTMKANMDNLTTNVLPAMTKNVDNLTTNILPEIKKSVNKALVIIPSLLVAIIIIYEFINKKINPQPTIRYIQAEKTK